MTKKEREYYNELSIKAFGVKSRWQTLLKKPRIINRQTAWATLDDVEEAMIQIIEENEDLLRRLKDESSKERSGEATYTPNTNASSGGNS